MFCDICVINPPVLFQFALKPLFSANKLAKKTMNNTCNGVKSMVDYPKKDVYTYDDLVAILRILRAPDGCPWDRAQTHLSNRRNFLEEAYEAAEAFDRDDPVLMCEELGDVLMQSLFNALIEEEAGRFTIDDVTDRVCRKLIFRHPHIFAAEKTDATLSWEELKRREKGQRSLYDTMNDVARSLPALWRAEKLQDKAGECISATAVTKTMLSCIDALREQIAETPDCNTQVMDAQIGALLFAAVGLARAHHVDPEDALHKACERYLQQFHRTEDGAHDGQP